MRVLISADMEGVTGVTCPEDVRPGSARWEYFRVMLTGDVNAAVDGFCAAGADEVLVDGGGNPVLPRRHRARRRLGRAHLRMIDGNRS
jgi:D-aminopeptidase